MQATQHSTWPFYCGSSDVILFPSLKAENAVFLFKNFRIAGKSAQTCEIVVNIICILI